MTVSKQNSSKKEKVPFIESLYKSQFSSLISSGTDYIIFFVCYNFFGVFYGYASVAGNVTGAVINFLLGRNWAFRRKEDKFYWQAARYAIISATSAVLNYYGIIYITEFFSINPNFSKIIIGIIVGMFFNFPMFRYFVFR